MLTRFGYGPISTGSVLSARSFRLRAEPADLGPYPVRLSIALRTFLRDQAGGVDLV
jgi:hypothetical protein